MGTRKLGVTEGQGEGDGSCESHVVTARTTVTTHSWDRLPFCLVQAAGEGRLSSTLQVLPAGLVIKLTQGTLAGEKLILELQTLLIFSTESENSV